MSSLGPKANENQLNKNQNPGDRISRLGKNLSSLKIPIPAVREKSATTKIPGITKVINFLYNILHIHI